MGIGLLFAAIPLSRPRDARGAEPPAAHAATESCPDPVTLHEPFSAILARRVRDGTVDYAGLKQTESAELSNYLAALSATSPHCYQGWSRPDRFAFWINAYNAFTLRLILDHYPIDSIRSIGWIPGGAFRQPFIALPALRKDPISLNTIEHEILRPEFRDARVHFAIVCASKSCPTLRSEAYRGAQLEQQLDEQARRFLAEPTKNRFDGNTRILKLSAIFNWFHEDFERDAGSIAAFVTRFAPTPMAAVARAADVRIEYLDYDWSLNGR